MSHPEFTIKDGKTFPCMENLATRLAAGRILPPVPKMSKTLNLGFIDELTRDECQIVYERIKARGRQLRTEDTQVYGVKRCDDKGIRYNTREPGKGWRQMLAKDIQDASLWLTSRRGQAQDRADALNRECPEWRRNTLWVIYAIPKVDAVKLPCYTHQYGGCAEMVGEFSEKTT
jgi:hypothetical protein